MSNVDTKANPRSILRRSSVVLQRRFSRDSTALEDFQAQQYNAVRRASVQQGSSYQPPTFQISASFQGSTSFMTGSSDSILNNIPPPRRRASITPAPYAPASYGGRRSSVIAIASSKKTSNTHERVLSGSLSKSSGIPYRYQLQAQQEQQSKADQLQQQQQQLLQQLQQHQHDYKKQSPKGQSSLSSSPLLSPSLLSPPLSSPLRESLSLTRDFKDMSVSDWDMSSNCSEVSEVFDEVDYTDPSDWFLDEEMEDEPMFEILEREDLLNRLRDSVASVASQLNVSEADAVLVLQQFNWDLERLLQDYFDKPNYYLKQAGVTEKSSGFKIGDPDALYKCKICLDDKPCSEFFALGCDHEFCKECWQEYLQGVAVTSGPSLTRTSCMAPKCTAILTEKDIERIALPSTLQRYMYFLLKEFSEKDLHSVMCPHPTCGNAVVYSGVGRPTDVVECHCGTRFCFSCGHEKHNPVCCEQLSAWQALLQDDSGSLDLIRATSKPCAHCGTFTERISGCNHMICRRGTGGCGGEWCWMCRKDWASHGAHTGGFYSCNKYEESEAKIIDDKSQEFLTTKNESKFLHYYNRYFNHDVIMKDVMKQLNSGEVQVTMVEYTKLTNTDPEFFLEAAELLVECRRVLKYTYVYGYYMEDGPSKALFEYQQASAEGITERLSELFHTPVDVISKSPLEFVNYVRVTKKFISNLVKSIEEGFSSDLELPSVH